MSQTRSMWNPSKSAKYGVVVYTFDGVSQVKYGLYLHIGETVQIQEECSGWYRGFSTRNKSLKGVFPKNYIRLKECKVDVEGPDETPIPLEDAVVSEATYVLREWGIIWKKMYMELQGETVEVCQQVKGMMEQLMECRRIIMSGNLTQDQLNDLKTKTTKYVDAGNKKLGLDLVPRVGSEQVDVDKIGAMQLFRLHEESSHKSQGLSSGRLTLRHKPSQKVLTHHLYMCYKSTTCNVGEDTEIHFSLYDVRTNKVFSERFLVKLTKNGLPVNLEKLNNYSTLFTDLGGSDLRRDAYLVAHVFRIGTLREGDTSKVPTAIYRRPYGCAVLSLRLVLTSKPSSIENEEAEHTMKVETCGTESDFAQQHENLIRKMMSKSILPSTTGNSAGIVVALKMMHGDLEQVRRERPMEFRGLAIARKLGFSDVIMPGDVRNDLYLTLVKGEFSRGDKTAPKNVEVRAMVIDSEGDIIRNCLFGGAGEPGNSEYNSFVYYHNNSPRWNDNIRINIPTEIHRCRGSHIRLELRHCSRNKTEKKCFAFGFIKLVAEDGTTVCDGPHPLIMYKCEDASKLKDVTKYIKLPSSMSDLQANPLTSGQQHFRRSERESVDIDTLLCSTKLTQNVDLLGLLKWKDNQERVDENLDKLMRLDGEEIVKYLQDIMDALFNMFSFVNGGRTPQAQVVFKALVYIISLLEDSKFEHFKPVMDAYIAKHFSAILVYKDLLTCLRETVDAVSAAKSAPSLQEPFQKTFKALDYISQCIVQSRLLYKRAFGDQDKKTFEDQVHDVFDVITIVISLNEEVVSSTQVVLLEHLPCMLVHLTRLMPASELCQDLCSVIEAIPMNLDVRSKLHRTKLAFLRSIVNSVFFATPECRTVIVPLCMGQLKHYLEQKQELLTAAELLGDILVCLYSERQPSGISRHTTMSVADSANVQTVLSSILDVLISTTLDVVASRTSTAAGHLVACVAGMLQMMEAGQYRVVLDSVGDPPRVVEFMQRILELFLHLVKEDVYPKDWMVIKMVTNNAILCALQFVSQTLLKSEFDAQLWRSYFTLAVSFLTQPCLQLEEFSDAKRQKILHKYGDMRVRMGYEILTMWDNLGPHKLNFIHGMVGSFLEMTLVPEAELREATIPIFFDMMQCEQAARGNFAQVESELIDNLDLLVGEHKGDDQYKHLFNTILLERVQTEPSWQDHGSAFIQAVTRLLERLLDYRNILEGEENRESRMTCTVNLLNFYRDDIKKPGMYVQYIYKLRDLHLACDNYTEAAFTLLLRADMLSWSSGLALQHDGPDDERTRNKHHCEWQRKAEIYHQVIEYFDQGNCWEYGIPLCKELASLYEDRIQYNKLSRILQTQAKFYDNILNQHRHEPEYFRVGFFGHGFPLFLRNKEFVYRGHEYERLGTFQQRLQSEFTHARIVASHSPVADSLRHGDAQFMTMGPVRPMPEISPQLLSPEVPDRVPAFYRVNDVDWFQDDRPFHKGVKDDQNEFKTLHIERTKMQVACRLPGILRWFEIVHTQSVTLTPIEVAIDSMENKNARLRSMLTLHTHDPTRDLRPFTMELKGTIDAAVNGGISKYQEVFFIPEYSEENPESSHLVTQLKVLFLEQVQILEGGLQQHAQLVSAEVRPLHQQLQQLFDKMKKGIRQSGSPDMVRLEEQMRDSGHDKRSSIISTISSASNKSNLSATPPGSNRSSGIFSETMNEGDMQGDSTASLAEQVVGGASGKLIASEPSLDATLGSTISLASTVSSMSLDSGISQGNRISGVPATSGTTASGSKTKPPPPPRKDSIADFSSRPVPVGASSRLSDTISPLLPAKHARREPALVNPTSVTSPPPYVPRAQTISPKISVDKYSMAVPLPKACSTPRQTDTTYCTPGHGAGIYTSPGQSPSSPATPGQASGPPIPPKRIASNPGTPTTQRSPPFQTPDRQVQWSNSPTSRSTGSSPSVERASSFTSSSEPPPVPQRRISTTVYKTTPR